MRLMQETIHRAAPGIPLILYFKTYGENLQARASTADILCAEAQDVLSQGKKNFTPFWLPTLNAKYGSLPEHMPAPFGIIHSCPGMDWRHTGLPEIEYRSWMSRSAANGANLWHSLTAVSYTHLFFYSRGSYGTTIGVILFAGMVIRTIIQLKFFQKGEAKLE